MSDETTYSGILGALLRFLASMASSIGDIPHLQATRDRFGETLGRTQELVRRQAAAIAEKQELSVQIKAGINELQLLATVLRKGLRQHYGTRSEKLAEFGLKPFRGRKPKGDPTPAPETPAPSAE